MVVVLTMATTLMVVLVTTSVVAIATGSPTGRAEGIATLLGLVSASYGLSATRGRGARRKAVVGSAVREPTPPSAAQYLLELLAPADWSEAAAGDFFERYEHKFRRVSTKHGVLLAKVDYWWQVLRSASGLLRIRFRDLAILGGLTKLVDVLREYWAAR